MDTKKHSYRSSVTGLLLAAWIFGIAAWSIPKPSPAQLDEQSKSEAGTGRTGIQRWRSSSIAGSGEDKEKEKIKITNRAKKIMDRAKTLTASVVNVSKGAKGVGAPITDREKWELLAKSKPFANVIREAETLQKESIPEPLPEDYEKYYESQAKSYEELDRTYEQKFHQRRNRLYRLVLAECFENQGRFLRDIEETVHVICSEPAWTHPWHDSDGKRLKGESVAINHDMARTAWDLATVHYWLGKKLSTNIRELIQDCVQERIFAVFEDAVLTDKYDNIGWANNNGHENAMCHSAVVGAAVALIDSGDRRSQYIAAAEMNVEKFLQIFTRDGYYADGVWAWSEGYGSFILLAETMFNATGGRIDMFKRPNIKETALYGPRMEILPGVYESFGDRWRGDRPQLFPTAFISMRFQMGLTEFENRAPFFGIGVGHLYMIGTYCFPNSATEKAGQPGKPQLPPLETLRSEFPLNGVMILRTGKKGRDQIGVQLKGGNNDERGNHSDVGNYIVALGNGVPICDIGARYNRRGLVVKDRMDSNFVNSFGHSVPRIDGFLQINGKGTVAPLLTREYTDECDKLKFDLQYVYEWTDPKDVKEFTREFIYDRSGKEAERPGTASLTVVDKLRVRKPVSYENCLITFGPYKMLTTDEDSPTMEMIVGEGSQALHVTVTNEVNEIGDTNKFARKSKAMIFEAGLIDEPIAGQRTTKMPMRLAFSFDEPVDEMTMTVKIRSADANQRDLAKRDPSEATRTYTSPIDDEALMAEDAASGGEIAKAQRLDATIDELKNKIGIPLETLKEMSAEQLKTAFERYRRMNPSHPLLKDLKDEDVDALIQVFKASL